MECHDGWWQRKILIVMVCEGVQPSQDVPVYYWEKCELSRQLFDRCALSTVG